MRQERKERAPTCPSLTEWRVTGRSPEMFYGS